MSNIIKGKDASQLFKFSFDLKNQDDTSDNEEYFSSLTNLIIEEETNKRIKEENLINSYREQIDKYQKEIHTLRNKLDKTTSDFKDLQEKYNIAYNELKGLKESNEKIITDAKKEANDIINNAKQQEEKIKNDAYESGFNEGLKNGEKQGLDIYLKKVDELKDVIEGIRQVGSEIIVKYEQKIIQLILKIAKTIVQKEVEINPSIIKDCIKNAMDEILDKSMIIIHVNPDDYNLVNEYINNELKKTGTPDIILSKDNKMQRGGVLIESKMGIIDITMETKWDILEKVLDDALIEKTSLSLYN